MLNKGHPSNQQLKKQHNKASDIPYRLCYQRLPAFCLQSALLLLASLNSNLARIYALAFEDEFAALDYYLEKLTEEEPIVGKTQAAVDNTSGKGYQTPYYCLRFAYNRLFFC